jgi:hypothetical protein
MEFLLKLEQSGFGTWVRESPSLFAYPTILFLHTVGLGLLVGVNVAIDLRILGFASELPLAPMRRFFPYMWAGFWVNAASGVALLIADASTKMVNPVFLIKIGLIVAAVVNTAVIRRRVFSDGSPECSGLSLKARALAVVSLLLWLGSITTGRLMAYIGPVSGLN